MINKISNEKEQLFPTELGRAIMRMGISPHISGFAMLGMAIMIASEDVTRRRKIVSDIYPEVAKHFGATPCGVERNIRTAISKAWASGAMQRFYKEMGVYADRRPSNFECISQLSYVYTHGMSVQSDRAEKTSVM